MLRKYKSYRYVTMLRRNVNLVRNFNGSYCILSTQSIKGKSEQWVKAKTQLLLGLHHPNIDRAVDVFVSESSTLPELVVVTEICENTSLDALLGGLSQLETQLAMLDLAEGLHYLHDEAHVLHRNIRGQSVLVRGGRYLISDFSEAQVLEMGGSAHGLAGKKQCMSPQMLAAQPYCFPSDVWSLGILFVELLVGQPIRAIENKIAALLQNFPQGIMARIPYGWAKEILFGMFEKNPQKRWVIKDVLQKLKESLGDPWGREQCLELKRFSESSRLLADRDRHLFVQKRFPTTLSEESVAQEAKKWLEVNHPNVVGVREMRLNKGECEATLEYCRSGPLTGMFQQFQENEVLDTIGGLWRGFCYLHERGLLAVQHLILSQVLVSQARPKLQLFTEKTIKAPSKERPPNLGIPELGKLFLELLCRRELQPEEVMQLVKSPQGLGLKEKGLQRILIGMLGAGGNQTCTVAEIGKQLTTFLEAKEMEETILIYGKYRVLVQIGFGALGKVYTAEDSANNLYALKVIPCRLESEKEEAELEAQNLSKTSHPNIVKLFEYFLNDSKTEMILAMECCEERTLREAVPVFTPAERKEVVQQLCAAIYYLHVTMSMVHRDVKPANILIRQGQVKLCDFGRSKFLKPGETMTGAVGATYYMPPQMANLEEYSFGVDIWNLGIVLLEVYLGVITCRNSIAFMDSAFPDNYISQVEDPKLRQLFSGMIQRQPAKRLKIEEVCSFLKDL